MKLFQYAPQYARGQSLITMAQRGCQALARRALGAYNFCRSGNGLCTCYIFRSYPGTFYLGPSLFFLGTLGQEALDVAIDPRVLIHASNLLF